MTRKEKARIGLFAFVLLAALVAMVASAQHTAEALAWANDGSMPSYLAATYVIVEVAFIALAVLLPRSRTRTAVLAGMALIQVVTWSANFAEGVLRTETRMPVEAAAVFGLPLGLAQRIAGFLYAGALPILVGIAAYACTKTADGLLSEPPIDPQAERFLEKLEKEFTDDRQQRSGKN